MRTLAVISAIALLAVPDLALAQGRRNRDDGEGGGRGRPPVEFVDRDERGGGRGQGQGRRDRDEERPRQRPQQQRGEGREARPRVPLRDVLPGIQRRTPGRILDSFPEEGPGGRPQYRVRWQSNDGQRIDYIVDAETGAILRRE